VVITLAIVGGIFVALDQLGIEALKHIGPRERYRVKFVDINSDTPPGMDPHKFLAEVRYTSGFPESFIAVDEAEHDHLKSAFLTHPWVEAVKEVSASGGRSVSVSLKFRL